LTEAGGGPIEYAGGDYLYANTVREVMISPFFQRYSISGDSWAARADPPENQLDDLAYTGGDGIYAISYLEGFYRYTISGNSWETIANTPGNVGGASLAFDGDDYIYALKGSDFTDFWRYSISGDSWETMASTPADVSVSDSMAYAGGYVYALRGGDTTDFWRFTPPTEAAIESCDHTGEKKDVFDLAEIVYVNGTGYSPSATYTIYLVNDVASWSDGMPIPARVLGTESTVSSDSEGRIPPTVVWNDPLTPGEYDILVDFNNNGVYDEGIDALDSNDIEVTAGFLVIPEFPSLLILPLLITITLVAVTVYGRYMRAEKDSMRIHNSF